MKSIWLTLVAILIAYIAGSFSSAYWLGKWFKKTDIRDHGSGNSGFANALRVFGFPLGISVLILDVAKGFLAVEMIHLFPKAYFTPDGLLFSQILMGISVMIGHLFPVFSQFRGGKGVATGLGVVLAIYPLGAVLSLSLFIVVLLTTRYFSLGSMLAGISFPVFVWLTYPEWSLPLFIFSVVVAVLVL
ncbi:MAG: glycerol-3-phosphate 1-O-acyltransferase PlsY, partial [Bacteroidales bacterium]|nr:glycerol-3-phosphate 1-O-acyltransferase PlsY [Bacteroidales bacterium]